MCVLIAGKPYKMGMLFSNSHGQQTDSHPYYYIITLQVFSGQSCIQHLSLYFVSAGWLDIPILQELGRYIAN